MSSSGRSPAYVPSRSALVSGTWTAELMVLSRKSISASVATGTSLTGPGASSSVRPT